MNELPTDELSMRRPLSVVVVILEQMWGPADGHRMLFRINPKNHSGRRLYSIMSHRFVVGDSCPGIVANARLRNKPSAEHLAATFAYAKERGYQPPFIVLGGTVAYQTFQRLDVSQRPPCPFVVIPHPAARIWSHALIAEAKKGLSDVGTGNKMLTRDGWRVL